MVFVYDPFDSNTPFWNNIISVKRDVKRLRKELKMKEQILNAYMVGIIDRFAIDVDSEDNM